MGGREEDSDRARARLTYYYSVFVVLVCAYMCVALVCAYMCVTCERYVHVHE